LYECSLELTIDQNTRNINCGRIGFRRLALNQENGEFALLINDTSIFCRGACWTVNDMLSLTGSMQDLTQTLTLARDAGMNMLRIAGTMIYEQDAFYTLCDALGILVWQDFMFANMDYPHDDASFISSVQAEAVQQLSRWRSHPCMAIYCGGSEIEQQAAMLGMAKENWRNPLFAQLLPTLCKQWHPDVPYIAASPMGEGLPFHLNSGVSHYYGVGAYLRPVSEVRRAGVRFASECLGLANIPEQATLNLLADGAITACHHPLWKQRTPRDAGAGWDFDDVRDHYLKSLYACDATQLRAYDTQRYLELSRTTSGELMSQVFSEWRSGYNSCQGGLVWFLKDLWPGAGWGIIDSTGRPKACFYALKRVWQSVSVLLTDEGLNGVHIHIVNETDKFLQGRLECQLIRNGRSPVAKAERNYTAAEKSNQSLEMDDVLGGFYDTSYAYRFGPSQFDVAVVTLFDHHDSIISEAFYFPENQQPRMVFDAQIVTRASALDDRNCQLTLQSKVFLYAVHFVVDGYLADDNYFHLVPGREKIIHFTSAEKKPKKFQAYIESLSLDEPVKITLQKTGAQKN
jgi:beta-mannosidase